MHVELVHVLQTLLDARGTCWFQRDGDGVRITRYLLGYILVFQTYTKNGWQHDSWYSRQTVEGALLQIRRSRCAFVLEELVYLEDAA